MKSYCNACLEELEESDMVEGVLTPLCSICSKFSAFELKVINNLAYIEENTRDILNILKNEERSLE